jgi:hypothetical protein
MKKNSHRGKQNKNARMVSAESQVPDSSDGQAVEENLTPARPTNKVRKALTIGFILALILSVVVAIQRPSVRTFIYLSCVFGVLALLAAIASLASKKLKWMSIQISTRKLVLLGFSLLFALGLAEGGLRFFFAEKFSHPSDERNLLYEYHETLGWAPPKNTTKLFTGASRTITVTHNSEGFRGPEPVKNDKPNVIFLGDSFVWGYDVEASERFTEKFQAKHPEWNVYNLGVSGYGTDQAFLLLQQFFDEYKPYIVILIFCTDNDVEDNAHNMRHGGYYKPYYSIEDAPNMKLNGVPVPRSERVLRAEHPILFGPYVTRALLRTYCNKTAPPLVKLERNPTTLILQYMRNLVFSKGGFFAIGVQDGSRFPELMDFLRKCGITHVELTTAEKYPGLGGHWTPEGHTFVCNQIDLLLEAAKAAGYKL